MNRNLFILFAILLLFGCGKVRQTLPVSKQNPWPDDYRHISGMDDYLKWGTYNVHDPSCKQFGEYYYMYSTGAVYHENRVKTDELNLPIGNIQVRRSKDLVNWEFLGWAFQEIPEEAADWVRSHSGGVRASNIWAPYIIQHEDTYRLYYCVSAFGKNTSYIGLAESDSPEGPWTLKGCVVKTDRDSRMNAIDPSVVVDPKTGKWWMHYGSYFGGLFCMELNPETGLALVDGDQGHLVARRANYKKDNLEAPEILYHPELDMYYLFVSYDPLMTTYNVRVGRSETPEGPFIDFYGHDMRDTINHFPILTAPYRFENHQGWAGVAHCAALQADDGKYFMCHQARLAPDNLQMVLHVREMFFNADGWPVVSPERYAGNKPKQLTADELVGVWEIIRVQEPLHERNLEAGQILWGEGELSINEWNTSERIELLSDGTGFSVDNWTFLTHNQTINLHFADEQFEGLTIFVGQDWENETETILFTGLGHNGRSLWGKKINTVSNH